MFGELQESGGKCDEEEEKHPEGEAAEEKEEKTTTTGLANSVRDLVSTTLTLSSRYGIQQTRIIRCNNWVYSVCEMPRKRQMMPAFFQHFFLSQK